MVIAEFDAHDTWIRGRPSITNTFPLPLGMLRQLEMIESCVLSPEVAPQPRRKVTAFLEPSGETVELTGSFSHRESHPAAMTH